MKKNFWTFKRLYFCQSRMQLWLSIHFAKLEVMGPRVECKKELKKAILSFR